MGKSKRLSRSTKPPTKFIGCSLPYHIVDELSARADRLGISLSAYLGELARFDYKNDIDDLEALAKLMSDLYLVRRGSLLAAMEQYCKAFPRQAPRPVGVASNGGMLIDSFTWG